MAEKRYYWLKLKRDFFKRHDIRVIEGLPNGKDYVLFYLKLLCESVDHDGNLRFSDHIPYNEDMLASITNTNVDIVRSAIKIFSELQMMEIMDDGTYYMNEVHKMLGSAADNDNANRQRRFRERQKELALQERYDSVTKNNESIEYRDIENRDKSTDKEKKINKRKESKPPTLEEVRAYAQSRNSVVDPDSFFEYFSEGNWIDSEGKPVIAWKQKFLTWENKAKERGKTKSNSQNRAKRPGEYRGEDFFDD